MAATLAAILMVPDRPSILPSLARTPDTLSDLHSLPAISGDRLLLPVTQNRYRDRYRDRILHLGKSGEFSFDEKKAIVQVAMCRFPCHFAIDFDFDFDPDSESDFDLQRNMLLHSLYQFEQLFLATPAKQVHLDRYSLVLYL